MPLFYIPSIETVWLPYEEYILWYYLHPDNLAAAKNISHALVANPDTPQWMRESVASNWVTFFCPNCDEPGTVSRKH